MSKKVKGVQIEKKDYPEDMLYNVRTDDKRIKSYFEIVNDTATPPIVLPVIAMSDGGSCGSLTLPARKIDMLGLTPIKGKAGRKSVTGVVKGVASVKLTFQPLVIVKFYFIRDGETEIETREVATLATCHETEYQQYMNTKAAAEGSAKAAAEGSAKAAAEGSSATESVQLPVTPLPPPEADAETAPTTPPATAIAKVTLSPAYHRPIDRPDQQVALGQEVLGKLAVHADFAHSVLWVEEEVPTEEDL
mmetsp:Transcript_66927/g.131769  ORF Transcript_66927/g.131769 Transcript_66927/m.131769 type:complete len:248 (+) Transcript_66927:73-816(+)|eukprot:CAMPEP_0170387790 /NCGR_PEP_ID=MMETSP0117_2-20130122/17744_1 /TAXON_ID=400756 /ORGANISM="Durinskia baltica, Strain CSIRO CS-38" /LENGTH=247 /DNA_ID=CAMNT_0010643679 /DNA_START=57 /DNA_END=800 /DNA_ORIENTATION=+